MQHKAAHVAAVDGFNHGLTMELFYISHKPVKVKLVLEMDKPKRNNRRRLDYGIIAGSRCFDLWNEEFSRLKGAKKLRIWYSLECECRGEKDRNYCFMNWIQRGLKEFEHNSDWIKQYFELAVICKTLIEFINKCEILSQAYKQHTYGDFYEQLYED